jgi:peptide/nickel transport system substrate-binding protein
MSIDRASIGQSLYQGQASPMAAFFGGPGTMGYPPDLKAAPYDPDKAKELLSQAGFNASKPLKVEIVTYNDDSDFPQLPTLAEAVAGYFGDVGITSTIRLMDWTSQKAAMAQGRFTGMQHNPAVSPVTIYLRGIDSRYNFIGDEISAYSAAGSQDGNAWDNKKLPKQQEFLDQIANEFDQDKLATIIGNYERFMADNYSQMPLLASNAVFGMSSKVASWGPVAGKPYVHNLWSLRPAN